MIVEEPDIEIGAGVSSKGKFSSSHFTSSSTNIIVAMSRRIATDTGGRRGPQSSRPARRDEYTEDRPASRGNAGGNIGGNMAGNNANGSNMPAMPFAFPTMPNGMPMFPPNFFQNFPQQGGNSN